MNYSNFQNRHIDTRSVVFNLIAINVLLFAATFFLPMLVRHMPDLREVLGLFYPASEFFKPIQLISHMFMHDGLLHIFFNMFNLYMFGTILEIILFNFDGTQVTTKKIITRGRPYVNIIITSSISIFNACD